MTGKSDFYFFFLSFVTRLLLFFIVDSLSILDQTNFHLPFVRTRMLRNSRTIVDLDLCRIVCLHDSKIQKPNVKLAKKLFFAVSQ
jgi:hypothetical protein